MTDRIRTASAAVVLAAVALTAACSSQHPTSSSSKPPRPTAATSAPGPAPTTGSAITEAGTTVLLPLLQEWRASYATANPAVSLSIAGTDSASGITAVQAGTANFGTTDAFFPAPGTGPGLVSVPLAVSALMVSYNVPGVSGPLNLNGTILARIFTGQIKYWDDKFIAILNPYSSTLPHLPITVVRSSDSSGGTLMLTSYVHDQDPTEWPASNVGAMISWPAGPKAAAAPGTAGMIARCGAIKGCVTYLGSSYGGQAAAAGLGTAALLNKGNGYASPTGQAVSAALATFPAPSTAGVQPLIDTHAATGYPIISYVYAVAQRNQPTAAEAAAVRAFLAWAISAGNAPVFLRAVDFQPLPPGALPVARSQIAAIRS